MIPTTSQTSKSTSKCSALFSDKNSCLKKMKASTDQENKALMLRYIDHNESLKPWICWSLGYGSGFCADMIGLLKMCIAALAQGHQLRLSLPSNPKGWAVRGGFSDYFEDIFPTVNLGAIEFLNRPILAYSRRHKPLRMAAEILLSQSNKPGKFAFDLISTSEIPVHVMQSLGLSDDWWKMRKQMANSLFNYSERTKALIKKKQKHLCSGEQAPVVSMHIRRGDKINEHPYTKCQQFIDALDKIPQAINTPIYVFSDHSRIAAKELEHQSDNKYDFRIADTSAISAPKGYDQNKFNLQPRELRQDKTIAFLAELEIMANSMYFIGSSSTNVFCWARYRRGNINTFDLQ
jgi:hypothetical protein